MKAAVSVQPSSLLRCSIHRSGLQDSFSASSLSFHRSVGIGESGREVRDRCCAGNFPTLGKSFLPDEGNVAFFFCPPFLFFPLAPSPPLASVTQHLSDHLPAPSPLVVLVPTPPLHTRAGTHEPLPLPPCSTSTSGPIKLWELCRWLVGCDHPSSKHRRTLYVLILPPSAVFIFPDGTV